MAEEQKIEFFNAIGAYWEDGKGPKEKPDDIPTPKAEEKEKLNQCWPKSQEFSKPYI